MVWGPVLTAWIGETYSGFLEISSRGTILQGSFGVVMGEIGVSAGLAFGWVFGDEVASGGFGGEMVGIDGVLAVAAGGNPGSGGGPDDLVGIGLAVVAAVVVRVEDALPHVAELSLGHDLGQSLSTPICQVS